MNTSTAKPTVTIELLDGDEARAIAAAVEEDNPGATVDYLLGIVAISAPSPGSEPCHGGNAPGGKILQPASYPGNCC